MLRDGLASRRCSSVFTEEFAACVKNDEKQLAPVIKALGLTNN